MKHLSRAAMALFLLLPSCANDATPALAASQAREGIFLRQSSAFTQIVTQASGIDEAARATMLAGIAKDREDYGELAASTNEWMTELGNVDWVSIAKRALMEWRATQ